MSSSDHDRFTLQRLDIQDTVARRHEDETACAIRSSPLLSSIVRHLPTLSDTHTAAPSHISLRRSCPVPFLSRSVPVPSRSCPVPFRPAEKNGRGKRAETGHIGTLGQDSYR